MRTNPGRVRTPSLYLAAISFWALFVAGCAGTLADDERLLSPKAQSEQPRAAMKKARPPTTMERDALREECQQLREAIARLRAENQLLQAENQQLTEEVRHRLTENSEFRARLSEDSQLREDIKALRDENRELREDIRKVLGAEKGKERPDAPQATPAAKAGTVSTLAPPQGALSHWLTTSSGKRHNSKCPFYKSSTGKPCGPKEGKACGVCGG
ncbi:MAG: hypothetical protein HYY24_12755 [Verrucomicrobia bacterium]|nr:hypothetical protein [Verrucomicrobiota bacterium]